MARGAVVCAVWHTGSPTNIPILRLPGIGSIRVASPVMQAAFCKEPSSDRQISMDIQLRLGPLAERTEKVPTVCQMEQFCGSFCNNLIRMRIVRLTKKQLSSVPCPTCGVPAGHRCLLQAGGLRFEPHTRRRVAAAEAIERKRTPPGP